ncbi:MAG: YeiH family protein [Eubacteriales bacterium]
MYALSLRNQPNNCTFVPTAGAALFAIALGIIVGNTLCTKDFFNRGTKFSESRLLEYSIVLTGLTLNLTDIMSVGWQGVLFIILQMTLTIIVTYFIGKLLRFGKKFSLLMCAGNSVCGSSAIGTVSGVIHPSAKDKGISITTVNLTGTVLMITLPFLTGALYGNETMQTSAMIGGTLQSVGQVIGSATFVNSDVVAMSTIFKIIRIIFIVFVALAFSKLNTNEGEKLLSRSTTANDDKKVKAKIPLSILSAFFYSASLQTFNIIPEIVSHTAHTISSQFEIIALAGIGMRVKFRDLVKDGPKALLYGGTVGICQVGIAIGLIFIFFGLL